MLYANGLVCHHKYPQGLKVPYHWRFQHCPKVSRISMTEFCESRNFEGLYYFELLPLWWFLSWIRQSVDLQIGDRLRRLELDFTNQDSPLASNAVISCEVLKDIFFLANQKFYTLNRRRKLDDFQSKVLYRILQYSTQSDDNVFFWKTNIECESFLLLA